MNSQNYSFTAYLGLPFFFVRCMLLTDPSLHITTNTGPEIWLTWLATSLFLKVEGVALLEA